MSLKFVLGGSGYGKSTYVYNYAMDVIKQNPKQRVIILVPDQFTMQTQMDLVKGSPQKGIMNIEVLSFSRLAHRIFEETGCGKTPVIDDTGKNLILRKCAVRVRENIPYLSDKLDRPGYIHEVKSAISEFMQYGITPVAMEQLIEYTITQNRKILTNKLKDLSVIYTDFLEYINEKYITTEEAMDVLANALYKSEIMRDSIVILDGFTGFTPIQRNVIGAMFDICKQVIMTLTMHKYAMTKQVNEENRFRLTLETYNVISNLAKRHECQIEDPEILEKPYRFGNSESLAILEKNLYGFIRDGEKKEGNEITINGYRDIKDEVDALVKKIRMLVQNGEISYREIAVITGNLSSYSGEIEERCAEYEIPVYLDENKAITLNPFVEYITAVLQMYIYDFTYETVMRYLRCGFTGLSRDEIDIFDNYISETGIKGKKNYFSVFSRSTDAMKRASERYERAKQRGEEAENEALTVLQRVNEIRDRMIGELEILENAGFSRNKKYETQQIVKSLYNFLIKNDARSKLEAYVEMFKTKNDFSKEKEYSQIFTHTCKLFQQIYDLIGDELMDLKEFYGILDAGFSEMEVGTIPQSVDRVIVGDMERTRLKPVKYLFFLGLNDGWVPRNTSGGGIISDADREFFSSSKDDLQMEFAPSPRDKMYIGRFYLYSNLTKPSNGLFMSYVAMDNDGVAMRPSYVVNNIVGLFTNVRRDAADKSSLNRVQTISEAKALYSRLLREYRENSITDDDRSAMYALTDFFDYDEKYREQIIINAFFKYNGTKLSDRIAGLLYGAMLNSSISRMETYAKCAYAYFLRYGIGLKERNEYEISSKDMGQIYHSVLRIFVEMLSKRGLDFFSFTEEEAKELIDEAVDLEAARYTDAILFESEQNKFIVDRMKSVMLKTVMTLAYQLKNSTFKPIKQEFEFEQYKSLGVIDLNSGKEVKLHINGKIDRLDVSEHADKVLVKIVDYKSGNKDFSLLSFYHGVQLQMVVYMNGAMEKLKKEYPGKELVPAALLYYHIDDPLVDAKENDSDEAIEKKIIKELRTKGLVSMGDDVLTSLDTAFDKSSDIIPVSKTAKGEVTGVVTPEEMGIISKYADYKLTSMAKQMLSGDISVNPVEIKKSEKTVEFNSCEYCDYKNVCRFDERMPGYEFDVFEKENDDAILEKMASVLGELRTEVENA